MEQQVPIRAVAHQRLTETAHQLRLSRPGMSMADAFELACLRAPEVANALSCDLDQREGRGHVADCHASNRKQDELGQRVRTYALGSKGRIDITKLKRFAEANGLWVEKYEQMNGGSRFAGIVTRLRALVAHNDHQPVFPA